MRCSLPACAAPAVPLPVLLWLLLLFVLCSAGPGVVPDGGTANAATPRLLPLLVRSSGRLAGISPLLPMFAVCNKPLPPVAVPAALPVGLRLRLALGVRCMPLAPPPLSLLAGITAASMEGDANAAPGLLPAPPAASTDAVGVAALLPSPAARIDGPAAEALAPGPLLLTLALPTALLSCLAGRAAVGADGGGALENTGRPGFLFAALFGAALGSCLAGRGAGTGSLPRLAGLLLPCAWLLPSACTCFPRPAADTLLVLGCALMPPAGAISLTLSAGSSEGNRKALTPPKALLLALPPAATLVPPCPAQPAAAC